VLSQRGRSRRTRLDILAGDFRRAATFAAAAAASDLQVLTASQLHTPLPRADLTALKPRRTHQLDYWQPETVGDLLFNYWD
jgi:hypothetical protein